MERVRALVDAEGPVKWLFVGDSITHGALHTFGWRDYVELFAERVRFELGRGMDVVINTGISGDTTRGVLDSFDWRVGQFRPQVMFLMIGMNDCSQGSGIDVAQFEANVNQLAERAAEVGAIPVLQTTCPILPGQAPERFPYLPQYMDAIRAVASREGLPLVAHARYWEEHADQHFYWMSNPHHPNEFGHRVFAATIYRALGIFDGASQSCRLHIP